MKHFLLILTTILFSLILSAQPIMVKDIIEGSDGSFPAWPENFASYNGKLIFSVDDQIHGKELWISDGSEDGTYMVKDINPSGGSEPHSFFEFNGLLYFGADDEVGSVDLWKSDGTESGTVKAVSLTGGSYQIRNFIVLNEELYFTQGTNLYKTDGTEGGTISILSNQGTPSTFIVFKDSLFFHAGNNSNKGLWKSDGTSAGTQFVKDILPDSWSSWYREPIVFAGKLFFTGGDTYDNKVWVSDGTTEGTKVFLDVNNPRFYTILGDVMIFSADNDLWKTDGTVEGTNMIHNFGQFGYQDYPNNFTVLDGFVYFPASEDSFNWELYKTDGTPAGTEMVKDITEDGFSSYAEHFTKVGAKIYFSARNNLYRTELWSTDGTDEGTQLVMDINQEGNSYPYYLKNVNDNLYFIADDGVHGEELWFFDVTTRIGTITAEAKLFSMAPNPASFSVNIMLEENNSQNATIEVFTMLGQKVLEQKMRGSHHIEISLENMSAGVYFIKVNSDIGCQILPLEIAK